MENPDLLTKSYDYQLDCSLIAERPASPRDSSRLMVYYAKSDRIEHRIFRDLPEILPENSQLIFNQSKVYPCRLPAQKPSGGKAEIFLLSLYPEQGLYPVMLKSNSRKKVGDRFLVEDVEFEIVKIDEKIWGRFNLSAEALIDFIHERGNVPIPPYIREGLADDQDKKDYQTIYAKNEGSVAAPTAGLHFTDEVFNALEKRKIEKAFVTLHVSLGTFKPVSSEHIKDHQMHEEAFEVDSENLAKLNQDKFRIAVGTTSLRVLESTYTPQGFKATNGSTDIFLYPGVEVNSINGLLTNFHLPQSTLLMLVSSLITREKTLELYRIAVEEKFRFYSYGDAMLILRDL